MFHYMAENPWPVFGSLGLVAGIFLVLLKTTQDGRYLVRALATLGIALGVLAVEMLWVTDNERIEGVVYKLAKGMEASDGDAVLALFEPQVSIGMRDQSNLVDIDPATFRELLKTIEFDWLRVTRIETNAGEQTKLGSAEFRVNTSGALQGPRSVRYNFATVSSDWSLGFRKTADGSWKVTRINPVNLPPFAAPYVFNYINQVGRPGPGTVQASQAPPAFTGRGRPPGLRGGGKRPPPIVQ